MGKNSNAGMRAADYDILKAATEDLFKKVTYIPNHNRRKRREIHMILMQKRQILILGIKAKIKKRKQCRNL